MALTAPGYLFLLPMVLSAPFEYVHDHFGLAGVYVLCALAGNGIPRGTQEQHRWHMGSPRSGTPGTQDGRPAGQRAGRRVPPVTQAPAATLIANLPAQLEVNVADPGYAVDPGDYRAPDQPHNPDPPHYQARHGAGRRITGLREPAGPVRHTGQAAAGTNAGHQDPATTRRTYAGHTGPVTARRSGDNPGY